MDAALALTDSLLSFSDLNLAEALERIDSTAVLRRALSSKTDVLAAKIEAMIKDSELPMRRGVIYIPIPRRHLTVARRLITHRFN